MIKKLLTTGMILGSMISANAQKFETKEMPALDIDKISGLAQDKQVGAKTQLATVSDTLYYFLRKHTLEASTPNSFPVMYSPNSGTTQLTQYGASWLNPDNSPITINKFVVFGGIKAGSPSTIIPVTVTVYSASPAGVPGGSIATATCALTASNAVGWSTLGTFSTPAITNGAFFIAYHATPVNPLDTALIALARGFVPTSTFAPTNDKFSDALGFFKYQGNFVNTTGQLSNNHGNAYEPILIPFVSFAYTATANQSAPTSTANPGQYCAHLGITYTNTTLGFVNSPQFNFNRFNSRFAPFFNTYSYTPVPDSAYNWSFVGQTPVGSFSTANVTHTFATSGSAQANLLAKYQNFTKWKTQDVKTWTLQIANCGLVGMQENTIDLNLSVYPNPAVNGKANIAGLEGRNTVSVYNMIGQLVSTRITETEVITVDLSDQVKGTYLVRVTDSSNRSKVVKIIND